MRIRHFAAAFVWAAALILAVPASAQPAKKENWIGAWGFAVVPPPPGIAMPVAAPSAPAAAVAAAASAIAAAPAAHLSEVKSPMVGTFYGSPEPGATAYVAVGQTIKKGQVLCIIVAMKIMNEIESEVAGTVVEVLATDAHPVEYGQVLFRVNPKG